MLLLLLLLACVAPDPYADRVVSFSPGDAAGYGQDALPDVVLGPPSGAGGGSGSTDVLSLGREGEIVLAFDDLVAVDGPGPDLVVYENPFPGWEETGEVAVSDDGETWHAWPCDPETGAGCAGVTPVAPDGTGGDAFDLADLGLDRAHLVRIRDTGTNAYDGVAGGFDLDAVEALNTAD